MPLPSRATPVSKSRLWTGRVISTILVLFLLLDAIAKIMRVPQVLQASIQLGWSPGFAVPIGITLLTCTLIYAIPQTSPFGALLLNARRCCRHPPPRGPAVLFPHPLRHLAVGRTRLAQ